MDCLDSIHTVRKTINFFNKHGNTVNVGLIDMRKAFDSTNIYAILNMLHRRKINPQIIKVMESWLTNSCIRVQWQGVLSKLVLLTAGVRQCGVLSPILFASYVDYLLEKLEL